MNGSPRIRLSRLRFRKRMANTIPVVGLMALAAITTITPPIRAADWVPSVAGNIPNSTADAVRPLTVIDREDIQLSGMRNVYDLLNAGYGRGYFNNFGSFRPFVAGSGRVAVLINGRRVSDSIFDLGTLPISGVERIEILGDSAAALRGGHAIGGAVNIVLKRDLEGLQVQASPTWTTQEGGSFGQGSVLWGGALGRGRLTIGADLFRREEILDKDRAFSRASWTPGGSFDDVANVNESGNTLFITTGTGDDEQTVARPLGDCRGSGYTGVLANPDSVPGTGCGFAYADVSWQASRHERESLFFNFDHPLGRNADVYLDFRAAWAEATGRQAPAPDEIEITLSEALSQETLNRLRQDIGQPLPETADLKHRFIGHGNRNTRADTDEYDLTLGFRGRILDTIGYNTYVRYYRHDTVTIGDTYVSESLIQDAIDHGRYNLKNPLSPDTLQLSATPESDRSTIESRITKRPASFSTVRGSRWAEAT